MHITKVTDAQCHADDCRKKINSKSVNDDFAGNEAQSPLHPKNCTKPKNK